VTPSHALPDSLSIAVALTAVVWLVCVIALACSRKEHQ
jgi:hypothetical protein